MKKHLSTIILVSVLVVGLSLLLYPTISDQWNYYHQSRAIAGYEKAVEDTDKDTIKKIRAKAKKYNKTYDEASKASDRANNEFAKAKELYKKTGKNRIDRILNNKRYS